MEAAAGLLHHAVRAAGRRPRARAVDRRRARRAASSPSRWRSASRRGWPARWRARSPPARWCWRTSSSATSRAATPRACSWRCACGRWSATSTAAGATRSCSAPPPACCGPRCGRSGGCTGCGWSPARGGGRTPPWREIALVGGSGRAGAGAVVRARVHRLGLGAAGGRARPPAQPRLGRVRRLPVRRGVPALGLDPQRCRVYLGAFAAVVEAWRARRSGGRAIVLLSLAVVSTALMLAVALMTQGGFAGNLRYVALPAAMVCILAGAGWVGLARLVKDRWGPRAGAALAAGRGGRCSSRSWSRTCASWRPAACRSTPRPTSTARTSSAAIAKAGGEERAEGVRRGHHRPVPDPGRRVVPAPARHPGDDLPDAARDHARSALLPARRRPALPDA